MIAINNNQRSITINNVRDSVGELAVLSRYFNINQVPSVICSPLRDDKKPSFSLFYSSPGIIGFRDLSTGDYGGIYDMLMHKFNTNIKTILRMIDQEMLQGIDFNVVAPIRQEHHVIEQEKKKIECVVREIKPHDLEFWARSGISEKAMKFGRIYPISYTIITYKGIKKTIPASKYSYAYVEFKDDNPTIKIYNPYSEFKWVNGHDSSVIDLWDKLPEKGEELIITSSRKDALCLWANLRIPSISFQSESTIPNEKVMADLKRRFKKIYVLYDNDFNKEFNAGRHFGSILCNKFGFTQIEIPTEYEAKDPSDLYKKVGQNKFLNIITKLLKTNNYGIE